MLRTILAASAATVLASPVWAETRTYDMDGFNAIEVSKAVDVVYTGGTAQSVSVEIDDGDFDALDMEVDGRTLKITRPKPRGLFGSDNLSIKNRGDGRRITYNGKRVPEITVYVSSPELVRLKASSSARATADTLTGDSLELRASSSADLEASGIDVARLTVKASSSGDIKAEGVCGRLEAGASSSGDLVAPDLTCETADIDVSSSGGVSAAISGGDVLAEASSSGDIKLTGTCGTFEAAASSSGDIDAKTLVCEGVDVKASSSGDINIAAADSVRARVSSSGDVDIYGEPGDLDVTKSSGGDVTVKSAT